jgi:hypothetical protein
MPAVLFAGLALFSGLLGCHVVWWRIARPRQEAIGLGALFMGGPSLVAGAGIAWSYLFSPAPPHFSFWVAIWLLPVALGWLYITVYPATQAISPTLLILLRVWEAEPAGLTPDEIGGYFTLETTLEDRIDDLVREGYARFEGEQLIPTPKGIALIQTLQTIRRMLGLPFGSG